MLRVNSLFSHSLLLRCLSSPIILCILSMSKGHFPLYKCHFLYSCLELAKADSYSLLIEHYGRARYDLAAAAAAASYSVPFVELSAVRCYFILRYEFKVHRRNAAKPSKRNAKKPKCYIQHRISLALMGSDPKTARRRQKKKMKTV